MAAGFESPEEIYARVYRELEPHRSLPTIKIRYCCFASANSFIRLRQGCVDVRITDLLEGAPVPVLEALAFILLAKLLQQPIPAKYNKRYRQYIHRQDIQKNLHIMRRKRGRKLLCHPRGEHYNLEELFEDLNTRFFQGLMAKPALGWE